MSLRCWLLVFLVLWNLPSASLAESGGEVTDSRFPEITLQPLEGFLDGCFATSVACATCHSGSENAAALRDESDENVAPYDLWKSSMMANAARDPLWRAMVSAEVAATPSRKMEIEAKCIRCHSPMASIEKNHAGETLDLSELYDADSRHNQIALDGVSCTVCHQITAENLGTPASFSGHFQISDTRVAFGPHDDPFLDPMFSFTGMTPTHGEHILSSELCATCHTLYTSPYEPDGTRVDTTFLEQSPYLEWKNSAFAIGGSEEASCQGCHVPTKDASGRSIATEIARNPMGRDFGTLTERSPIGRHIFVGGNTLIPRVLARYSDVLQPTASAEAFAMTESLAREQLQTKTATIEIVRVSESDDGLNVLVEVVNLCGHKFPSAHPIRRAWIHVRVMSEEGNVLFESGGFDAQAKILDHEGQPLASEIAGGPVLPHYDLVVEPNQVQIYSVTMEDANGRPTHSLMRAAGYEKDNRLLPNGWVETGPSADETQPVGVNGDASFQAGRDQVRYRIPQATLPLAGNLRVEVQLLYQTLSTRHQAELYEFDTAEVRDLRVMLAEVGIAPETVGQHSVVWERE